MSYGNVYVGHVAFGAKDTHVVKTLLEAESWPGPSIVIAYSHSIAHGYDMAHGCDQQRLAVQSGVWPLFHFDPRRIAQGEPPLVLDSEPPKIRVRDYMINEARFRMTEKLDPQRYRQLLSWAQAATEQRFALYQQMATIRLPQTTALPEPAAQAGPPEPVAAGRPE
jgi:pyruvate-ferredoxin/flavodoxin oxidoreductase